MTAIRLDADETTAALDRLEQDLTSALAEADSNAARYELRSALQRIEIVRETVDSTKSVEC